MIRKKNTKIIWLNWLILDSGEMIRKEKYKNTNYSEEKYERNMVWLTHLGLRRDNSEKNMKFNMA